VPRLDRARVESWRGLQALVGEIERGIDDELRADWDIPLGWFDVLASLARMGGRARPLDVANDLRLPPSSVSRRFDRLEEEGWIKRHRHVDEADLRAVDIELTRTGRRLWREMNVSYRRAVQLLFATHLDADDIEGVRRVLDALAPTSEVDR
jgi:DNA-binding MarR family transcriptional regulator